MYDENRIVRLAKDYVVNRRTTLRWIIQLRKLVKKNYK